MRFDSQNPWFYLECYRAPGCKQDTTRILTWTSIYIYNLYYYISTRQKPAHGCWKLTSPRSFRALPWGLLLSFDDGALMESWTGRFLNAAGRWEKVWLTTLQQQNIHGPLKLPFSSIFQKVSFYSKASCLFVESMLFNVLSLGVHLIRIAKSSKATVQKGNPWDPTSGWALQYTKTDLPWPERMLCHTPILPPFLKKDLPISYEVYHHISSLRWSN